MDKTKIKSIVEDFYKYCETNLKIVTVENELIVLKPTKNQKRLVEHVVWCLENDQPIRVIILKARREGMSTIIEALIYWWTATHRNINSKVIAHDLESASTIYQMFRRFYDNSEPLFKPQTKYDTKRDLTFDTKEGKGIKSKMSIATADNYNVGRGDTISWLHASEVAYWKDGSHIMAGLMQAVSMLPKTAIFVESTANGMGGYFYDEWQAAKEGKSSYTHFFFPWFEHDDYRLTVPKGFKLTAQEQEWKRIYELDDEQIYWYRMKAKEFVHNPDLMKQEYPFNDSEAFLVSGRPRFNTDVLARMESKAKEPRYYDIWEKGEEIQTKITELSPLKVWRTPRGDRNYVIGVDVAEGLDSGDYSVATVIDKKTMETVARWRGHIEPADLGDTIEMLGRWYNKALIGVEVNNHGLTVVQRLRDRHYQNLYRREKGFDERFETHTAKLGWRTDAKSKPMMINDMAEAIKEQKIKDYDIVFIRECMKYVIDSRGRTNAQEGSHDDCFVAGTQILTDTGNRPIEKIRVGDLVMTRDGLKPVVATRNKVKPVIDSRIGLTGTPDHPIITKQGEIPLSNALDIDTLYTWNEKLSSIEEKSITEILNQAEGNTGFTTGDTTKATSRPFHYTAKYISTTLGRYLRGISFITKTTTLSTMNRATSRFSLSLNTQNTTWEHQKEESSRVSRPRNKGKDSGTVCRNGAKRIQKSLLELAKKMARLTLTSLERHSGSGGKKTLNSSPNYRRKTSRRDYNTRKLEDSTVRSVAIALKLCGEERSTAQSPAPTKQAGWQKREKVYNIQVAEKPEYFANNILVHNCVISFAIALQMFEWSDVSVGKNRVQMFHNSKYKERKDKMRKLARK